MYVYIYRVNTLKPAESTALDSITLVCGLSWSEPLSFCVAACASAFSAGIVLGFEGRHFCRGD